MLSRQEVIDRLSALKPVLTENYGLMNLGLFGSYARNEQTAGSDIDLLVEIDTPDFNRLAGILIFLEGQFPVKIDLVRKRDTMREKFLTRIEKEIVYV